jgi:DNA-binding cell septation regulator SpoVG
MSGVVILAWRAAPSGSALRAFVTVELPSGLVFHDLRVFRNNGHGFVSPPNRPVMEKGGRQKVDADGKPAFPPIITFRNPEVRDHFSELVLKALLSKHPEALGNADRRAAS